MPTTIESLELEVQSNATQAKNGIDALTASLNKLKSAAKGGFGLSSISKQLISLNASLGNIGGSNAENLNKIAQGLKSLSSCGNIKISSSIATQITNIGNAVRTLNGTNFSSINSLINAISPLSNLGKSNLNSFISQLQRLPAAMQSLNSIDLESLSGKISKLANAFSPLSQIGKNNLTSYITQLSKLPQLMKNLKSVDIGTLTTQIKQLANAFAPLATQMQSISAGFASFPNKIQRLIQTTNNLSTSNNKASKSYVNLGAKIAIAVTSLRSIGGVLSSFIRNASHSVEVANQFSVSMGQYAEEAYNYAQQVNEIMGIDPTEWMQNQSVFMTITKGFGVASDRAYTMSQNLTQLGYDLTSFFDLSSTEDAMQKLQSGISGELEPLRRLGYDLSVARLQQEALNLGISKSVNEMTQAEKAELRYYAIMTQVSWAQNDMARTLQSPTNQLRIFKSQLNIVAREIGNLFIPLLNSVLPYLIAFAKVLREVISIVGRLLGLSIAEVDWSAGSTSMGSLSDNIGSANEGLDDAAKKTKELKNAMLGIDELNVISPQDDSSSSGYDASGTLGGSLGFELPEYNFLEGAINQKVDSIVQSMKEWLGITGEINSWSDLFNTNLGKILAVVGLIGGAFLAWKISKPFVNAFSTISSLFGGKKSKGKSGGFSVPSPKSVLKGLADIALIIGGLVVVVEAIGLLMQIPGFEAVAKDGIKAIGIVFEGLWDIILPLTTLSLGVIGLGKIGVSTVAKGFADLSIIIGGVSALITAIGALISIPYFSDFLATGIDSVVSVFNGLWEVALPIGTLSAGLIVLGIASPATILSGLVGLASVIGGVELVLVALGALKQIPGFTWIVGEGGKVLAQLGEILGSFAGSIVKGFLVKVSDSFPEIGKNLADFMTNAQPFFSGLESVNTQSISAVKSLVEIVLLLTAADVIEGLTSWFTGGNSLINFGNDLAEFAPKFVEYSKAIKDVDGKAVQASATAAKSMAEFADNIPNSGGVAGFFAGENDIDVWGAKLPSFGRNFKKYSDSIKGVDSQAVEASSTAAKSIVAFANDIPNEGGIKSWFTGENNIDVWGEKLPSFGKNFKNYSDSVKGIDGEAVTSSSTAAQSVVAFAQNIPNEGGLKAWFTGENSIDTWGSKLPGFGKNFAEYAKNIEGVNPEVVKASSDAINSVVAFADKVPDEGGLKAWFTGENSIASFGEELASFGKKFKSYYGYIGNIKTSQVSSLSDEMMSILDWTVKISDTDPDDIESFGESLSSFGEDFASCASNIVDGFTEKISSAYEASKSSVISWGNNVRSWFSSSEFGGVNADTFSAFASNAANGFKTQMAESFLNIKPTIVNVGNSINSWFTTKGQGNVNKSVFSTYAQNVINGFKDTIGNKYTDVKNRITTWANSIKQWFTLAKYGQINKQHFYTYAQNVIKGFNEGIIENYKTSHTAINSWANDIKNTFTENLDEHSPSRKFFEFGVFAIDGFNNAITTVGKSTKPIIDEWTKSFLSVSPKMSLSVDTSSLKYYGSDSFTKSISANVTSSNNISVIGFEEAMKEFYQEYLEQTIMQIAEDVRRQADKEEQTVVKIGNRTITNAVTTQRKANGYSFTN